MFADSDSGGFTVFATEHDVPREPTSHDPLGFGASAERLADAFAPGLTVSTRSVRYYQLLATGMRLAAEAGSSDPRSVVLKLERLWAMASYLADPTTGDRSGSGLAGIQRVRAAANVRRTAQPVEYEMFSRNGQARYGVWALYRRSAEQMHLLDELQPTDLGIQLSEQMILDLRHSHLERLPRLRTARTATDQLTRFGQRSGLFAPIDHGTASAAWAALRADPARRHAASTVRARRDDQTAMLEALRTKPEFATQATGAIAMETCHSLFTRLFDAAVTHGETGDVHPDTIRGHPVLLASLRTWKADSARSCDEMEAGGVDADLVNLGRGVSSCAEPWSAVELLIEHHAHVQTRKGRQPFIKFHGDRAVGWASAPLRRYDPLSGSATPPGHDLRLRNLRRLAREIHDAGVTLT